ncbi:DUF2690 domain-containing protein [Nocardiopsis sp. CA-288880]|uniref:DUF2690 domain-containing protein n=1 Tax=Nocardiopsis sp. CA-288880 TaxID=3239995 RepID=UPI003D95D993
MSPTPRGNRFRRLASVAAAAAGLLTLTAVPASAHVYDGADPQSTGCSANSTTVDQISRDGMTFQLRWSSTCSTNWVRIVGYPGTIPASQRAGLWMDVRDVDRGVSALFTGSTSISGTRWGNMVYSPGSNCALGRVNYKVGGTDGSYDLVLSSSSC